MDVTDEKIEMSRLGDTSKVVDVDDDGSGDEMGWTTFRCGPSTIEIPAGSILALQTAPTICSTSAAIGQKVSLHTTCCVDSQIRSIGV